MQRVFELGRNFRNEGADATHNPEFTSLEAYQAFADYTDMRRLVRDLILAAAVAVHGAPVAHRRTPDGDVETVDLSVTWPVVPVHEAVGRATGAPITPDTSRDDVLAVCRAHDVPAPGGATAGEAVVALYEALVEPLTTTPTFYTDFPVETSPLTRAHRADPRLAERWDLVAYGAELGTAYSELTDPVDQRRRLTEQSLRAAAGDPEAMQLDESFLRALEYGMPPDRRPRPGRGPPDHAAHRRDDPVDADVSLRAPLTDRPGRGASTRQPGVPCRGPSRRGSLR